ncbi:adhesion G-protein coupled receptor F3 [Tautogolabrus adspersus]
MLENRIRMWTFILLYILGLNLCQTTGQDNSTQMYYVRIKIEQSAIPNITQILKPFVSNDTLDVDILRITTSVVKLSMPPNPVHYNSQQNIRCTVQQDLSVQAAWQLTRDSQVFDITTGTESKIQSEALETNIALSNTSELWAGEYTCEYRQKRDAINIYHKASGVMDVCLKPNIDISLAQGFPHCQGSTEESGVFSANTYVGCDRKAAKPQLTCSFKNRCNQTTSASIDINIIFENDQFCDVEGDWKKTKAGFTSKLKCKDKVGQRQRKCNNGFTRCFCALKLDFLGSSSNLLDKSLSKSWETNEVENSTSLAERYLSSVEQLIHSTNITQNYGKENVELEERNCSQESHCINKVFNNTVTLKGSDPGSVKTAGFKELGKYLPNNFDEEYEPNSIVVSTTTERNISDSVEVKIEFQLIKQRPRNFKMICASWDNKTRGWSTHKCEWKWEIGSEVDGVCVCEHLSSFAIMMGKYPLEVRWITETTYVGLSVSVVSLVISLVLEVIVWGAVVKTNSLHLRHTAHVNICLCLLVADCCFLASSKPDILSQHWCKTFVVLKHFCYLAMFFWMLWLSSALLHQTMYLFHQVSKKKSLKLSFAVGYVCPLLIVTITFLAYKAGAEGHYYSKDSCWLVYTALFKGSIHTFVIPVGIIVFFNIVAMLVVILKLLDHSANTASFNEKEKKAVVTVMRTVILLTPIFGVTWIFGFAVMILDLSYGTIAYVANYAFTLMNAFQGFFILLTTFLGDPLVKDFLFCFFVFIG